MNTQFHVAKELVDHNLGFEIHIDVYYDPATLSMSNHNSVCGRGNNTGFPSGMFLPGIVEPGVFVGKWKNGALSQISKTGLTADWYRYKMIITATTCQIKLLNLRTNVELSGNVVAVGTSTVGEDKNFTFLCFGIDGTTGAYGSVGVNYSNIKISRGSTCLLNVPLSEGTGSKVTDICNSSQYQLSFFTSSSGWAKLSDYCHHNFRYGFTLYTKSASPNLYIPNTAAQTEISITPPSGYARIANYKECRKTFNQCENVFVLDNVNTVNIVVSGIVTDSDLNGSYELIGLHSAYNLYQKIDGDITTRIWKNGASYGWNIGNFSGYAYFQETPAGNGTTSADFPYNATFFPTIFGVGDAVCELTENSDLYNADPDFVLFTENTGVAKEINIGTLDVNVGVDRGYLYINPNISEHDFMLYGTNKTLLNDVKIIKYIGLGGEIVYDESGEVVYDENDHAILE